MPYRETVTVHILQKELKLPIYRLPVRSHILIYGTEIELLNWYTGAKTSFDDKGGKRLKLKKPDIDKIKENSIIKDVKFYDM